MSDLFTCLTICVLTVLSLPHFNTKYSICYCSNYFLNFITILCHETVADPSHNERINVSMCKEESCSYSFLEYILLLFFKLLFLNIILFFFKFSLERDQNLSLLDYPFFLDPTSKVCYIVPDIIHNLSSFPPSLPPPPHKKKNKPSLPPFPLLSPFPFPTLLWKVSGISD